jgi:tetratricopeptide (TPR) repeat protein
MKTYAILISLLLPFTLSAAEPESTTPFQVEYTAGKYYFEQGQLRAASDSFLEAIKLSPSPTADAGEYIPYIYLSAAQYEMGNTTEARDALVKSQVYGVASKTETGKLLLGRYAADIMSAPLDSNQYVSSRSQKPAQTHDPEIKSHEVKAETVTEEFVFLESEDNPIPEKVLRRCAKYQKQSANDVPWHFHYKCGVDLMKAGQPESAVNSFLMGANTHENSARSKRMYGMWFIDYLPYYQIALAHSKLGDWESARNAIEVSVSYGEFSPADPDYGSFTELNQLINTHLKSNDS